ncbi:UDP-glycosyltransferase 88A1-like protein [Corchorus capsularis]|uniref:UDP-glycosyltransferase 88A1-like protein n=1 Tax=Corchorus capsularis TaxID=210143 RepID=A0A1R3HFE9_COCAP|nr:UDP-glycosyltransferase 88A1-like protein [Corchorus capsularis]
MVELGKLILSHHPSFTIIIFITTPPFNACSTTSYIAVVSATTPSISFHNSLLSLRTPLLIVPSKPSLATSST